MPGIDPSFAVNGAEFQVGPLETTQPAGSTSGSGSGFGAMLGQSIQALTATQEDAATASQQLATGQASDPTAVVMAVERAQLAMQLASQIRTKAVEAAQDLFHTQV
jgi:flagellar hook-basal body complex protein FliE